MRTSIQAAAAVAILLVGICAFAENSAEATLSLNLTLIDLDPNDGITPWMTLGPLGQASTKSAASFAGASVTNESEAADFSNISSASIAGVESANSSIAGHGLLGPVVFHASSSANDLDGYSTASAVFDSSVGGLVLSPHTELYFAGSISMSAQTTSTYPLSSVSWAIAYLPDGNSLSEITDIAQGVSTGSLEYDNLQADRVNDSDHPVEVGVLMGLAVFSWSPLVLPPPIPEPASALLLLGGLMCIGVAARGARAGHAD